jgi:thymidylate synthase ThyX
MNIKATIILDSIYQPRHARLTTFELEYPRFILAELNTHRMLSRNTASSRAIPAAKMQELIKTNPAQPVVWGKNQAGMQAKEQLDPEQEKYAKTTWLEAMHSAVKYSEMLNELGVHKQITNRVTEPYQMVKSVVTATEWSNFFWLRNHPDAQPEFKALAEIMYDLYRSNQPTPFRIGDWHLPYVKVSKAQNHQQVFIDDETGLELKLADAIKVSASCCAQVSYRRQDTTLEKARRIYDQLIESKPAHASPVEHQATPISTWDQMDTWGITHQDRQGEFWSANFRGWIQYRKTIPGEAKW